MRKRKRRAGEEGEEEQEEEEEEEREGEEEEEAEEEEEEVGRQEKCEKVMKTDDFGGSRGFPDSSRQLSTCRIDWRCQIRDPESLDQPETTPKHQLLDLPGGKPEKMYEKSDKESGDPIMRRMQEPYTKY